MDPIINYLIEAGMLKRVKRSGWWTEGVKDPESVADHVYRTAVLAFVLSKMEGLDDDSANRVAVAAIFHDMHEARLGDMNKITQSYLQGLDTAQSNAERDQVVGLPPVVRSSLIKALELPEREMAVLKDADYLECAIQAKEYADMGHKHCLKWLESIAPKLKSKSAKKLLKELAKTGIYSWREGLPKRI